ncbi:putative drug exporter of the RND superfamily [Microbispora rosea]|uniref:Putative drug exporter of the RND superfamily n=1 Tax=Microbispora rosea TaxID=58117 RepID=A0A1N7B7R7_9ACTN|nr:MMPL family transporter [Microbispora rosea]GIH51525.1 membrane protein [Microbispora rosea subsp. rosea]SIR47395.1 putative drug exporter of the RND superfamily [Microbispora rosea]
MPAGIVVRRAGWVVVVSALITLVAGVVGAGTIGALSLNRFEAPGSESARARDDLARLFRTGSPNVALLVTARQGTVDSGPVEAAGRALTRELAAYPGVGDAWSYWTRDAPATLRSGDGRQAMVLAWVPGDADRVRRAVLPALTPRFTRSDAVIDVRAGGSDEVFRAVMEQARQDFVRAELVVLPMVLLLLWLVYRRLAAALVTLGVGIFAVAGSLALLRGVVLLTEVSTFASNIALVMGVGLGVDYGLFVIFRFREELRRGLPVPEAVTRTVRTAGRTVLFSGVTVAASLSVLFAFPFPFLRSFAYAGVAVVVAAVIGATGVLPAALVLLGHAVARAGSARVERRGFWHGLALRVVRRPLAFGGAALAVVLLLGSPFLGVRFGLPDDRVLPSSAPVRQMYDQVRAGFSQEEADAVHVVAPEGNAAQAGPYAAALSRVEGVVRVDSAAGSYAAGRPVPGPADTRFAAARGTWLSVVAASDRLDADASGLVRRVRAVPAPFAVEVGGYPAELTDYRDGVTARLPLIGLLIVLVTFAVLFVMTGSVVAPLKASALNLLSLSVMFGALVFVFQDGHLSELLGFTPTGSIEPSIPILMFCVAYGLSMDYEVFLLARIKEEWDQTGDAVASVPAGIARSAPLVTAAAAILAASFAAYATGRVVFLQQLGVGMALTVAVDATLIRGVLVPALMRLAGPANWWAPARLRRLHRRLGVSRCET